MTCIVGLIDKGIVYMGGDSASTSDCDIRTIKEPKVFKKGNFLFGMSGNPRMYDILKYNFDIPEDICSDPLEYFHKVFIPEFKKCLSENGFLVVSDEVESVQTWTLIGYKGRLFELNSDFHIFESSLLYHAIGCGASEALGCLYGLNDLMKSELKHELPPESKIHLALRASEAFDCHVRRPFTIISSDEIK